MMFYLASEILVLNGIGVHSYFIGNNSSVYKLSLKHLRSHIIVIFLTFSLPSVVKKVYSAISSFVTVCAGHRIFCGGSHS
jgi:hypothetical protein